MSDLAAYIIVAPSNNTVFTDSKNDDVIVYTETKAQKILIGNNQGDLSQIAVSSNLVKLNDPLYIREFTTVGGLQLMQNDGSSANLTSVTIPSGFSNVISGIEFSIASNTSNNSIRFTACNAEVAKITGDGNVNVVSGISASNTMYRNRIINGDMQIDQRLSGALSSTTNTYGYYSADRWFFDIYNNGSFASGSVRFQQVADAPTSSSGLTYSRKMTVSAVASTTNNVVALFSQYIEGNNIADFAWGTVNGVSATLSFWTKTNMTGTHLVCILNGDGSASYITTFNVSSTNTWEYKRITIPAPTNGTTWATDTGIGISVRIYLQEFGTSAFRTSVGLNTWQTSVGYGSVPSSGGYVNNIFANTANYVQLTGVQFEKGTLATPFERRSYSVELSLCRRYYESVFTSPFGAWSMNTYGLGAANNVWFTFRVTKRVSPTLVSGSLGFSPGTLTTYATPEMFAYRGDIGGASFFYGINGTIAYSAELYVQNT